MIKKEICKKYRFFFHYNKPLSRSLGKHMWSVHYKKKCLFAEKIVCNTITESKTRNTQPYVVMEGFATEVVQLNNKIFII